MTIIKSFSVGNGDMFYIKHNSSNFSIIDCCMNDDNKERIVEELKRESKTKDITRFISTHPDDDHIKGLEYLDSQMGIRNFYCVKNETTKEDTTTDFEKYCKLRDSDISFYIEKGCSRKWLNESSDERRTSGIHILWPILNNTYYKTALQLAKDGGSPNNISPIIKYSLNNGATILWMGDLETEFLENIKNDLNLSKVHILFAPHHGRDSGKIPNDILSKLNPDIIIVGEAPSKDLHYYPAYNTITQNSAGDITFDCIESKVHVYASNKGYSVEFLDNEYVKTHHSTYIGTLNI